MKAPSDIERIASEFTVPAASEQEYTRSSPHTEYSWLRTLRQFLRFGLVGGLNTVVDLLILNALLWLFPTRSTFLLIVYNSIAYGLGAINSFVLNKYWTFGGRQKITLKEVARFVLTTCAGIAVNDLLILAIGSVLHPFIANTTVWTNTSKILAIFGTASISYLGMRLWVFANKAERHTTTRLSTIESATNDSPTSSDTALTTKHSQSRSELPMYSTTHSLSVVLPAHNEEHVIVHTVLDVLDALAGWMQDFEVIVVDDGSTDQTGALVVGLARSIPQVRLVTHPVNQGYGAALVSGFAAATKELTFFMDSDGQFAISDLEDFFPFIDEYEAVIGYRLDRQDAWIRKLNAWGWKLVVRWALGVHVRDIDCAFKLLHTQFLHDHPLETRSALINAELLYKLTQAGYTYREIAVHHLPRQGGQASGANVRVILRAFRDLFTYASRWKRADRQSKRTLLMKERI